MNMRPARVTAVLAGLLGGIGISYANIVVNGGFELPAVPAIGQFGSIPGWTLDALSVGNTIEIQNTALGLGPAYEASQYCELNSTGTTGIYQDLTTIPGMKYSVSYAHSPRPGVTDNLLHFSWDGGLVDTVNANGIFNSNAVWTLHTYTLTATGSITRIEFDDLGDPNNSLGTFVDAVNVELVPEPGSLWALAVPAIGCAFGRRRRA